MLHARMMRCLIFICGLALFFPGFAYSAPPAPDQPFYFLALADFHFDPFNSCFDQSDIPCPLIARLRNAPVSEWNMILNAQDKSDPKFNRDTNYRLLQQTINETQVAVAQYHPNFVLVLGDTLGHEFRRDYQKYTKDLTQKGYQRFVAQTLEYINTTFKQAFPAIDVFMLTGNNDTYTENYQSIPGGAFFHDSSALWSKLIQDGKTRQSMRDQFVRAGYYAVDLPRHPGIRLLALNTVLFSKKSLDAASLSAAQQELNWLHQELQQAKDRGQQVIITMHIPPSFEVDILQHFHVFTAQQFFQPELLVRFKNELAAFYPEIAAVISGHLHYDWQQQLKLDFQHSLTVVTVPSISPIFGNDPAFKVYHYVPAAGRLDTEETYTYPLEMSPAWIAAHATM